MAKPAAPVSYTIRRGTEGSGSYRVQKSIDGVKSSSYWVRFAGEDQTCTCPQWQYRRRICKHMCMVNWMLQEEGEAADALTSNRPR